METHTHARLKRLAFDFLLTEGCAAVAAEVACPISRYRIDVAGYLDKLPARARTPLVPCALSIPSRAKRAATVLIECKASRSDFFRDHRQAPALLRQREHLRDCLARFREEMVKSLEPHLRRSEGFLFTELEEWDFARSNLYGHRALVRALRRVDAQLYSETKFFMIAQYCLGARLLILAPRGMITSRELPRGWGLLEADADQTAVRVAIDPPAHETKEQHVQRTLRNIAAAATRDIRRAAAAQAGALSCAPALNGQRSGVTRVLLSVERQSRDSLNAGAAAFPAAVHSRSLSALSSPRQAQEGDDQTSGAASSSSAAHACAE